MRGVKTSTTTPPGGREAKTQPPSAEVKRSVAPLLRGAVAPCFNPPRSPESLWCPSGCNCHGHSETCRFDIARFEATGGVSGSVCEGCRHGRTGPQCELCQPSFYQDPRRPRDHPQACIRTPHLLLFNHLDVGVSSSAGGGRVPLTFSV